MNVYVAEITSPNYPAAYESDQICSYSVKSEPGSQISVNFMDLDLHEPDFENNCNTEYLEISERVDSPFSLVGSGGKKFCGQWLPNYPGPSVLLSSKYEMSPPSSLIISLQVSMR